MRDIMMHRGPDDCGLHLDGSVGLAHRRLSIIDLSTGQQPMSDPSGRVWIVFNGEIYNFPQLRASLEAKGHSFRTQSDTEVILAEYLEDPDGFPNKLNGIFAFAIWDSQRRRLTLVRDRVGVKPLYLWHGNGLLAAASEIKALLACPEVSREVDHAGIAEYLAFRQLAGNRTLFLGIESVAPGEMIVVTDSGLRRHCWWELPRPGAVDQRDEMAYIEELDALLRDATQMQMISDVPLGTYNSGGVDSSLVTGYVAEKAGSDLNTFCIGLPVAALDERPFARLVADRYGTCHREIVVGKETFCDCLPDVVWFHDEPLTHPNTVPMYLLSRKVKDLVTVALTGEGCDEFFGGYPRYRIGAILQALGPVGRALGKVATRALPDLGGRFGKLLGALELGPDGMVAEVARYVRDATLDDLLEGPAVTMRADRTLAEVNGEHLVERMLQHDQRNYLLPILNRLDRATMAASLEARVPFLDHRLIEFAASVPVTYKVRMGETKYLVKKLAERKLPRKLVYRRKSGFALPLREWFLESAGLGRYLEMLLEPRTIQRGLLRASALRRLIDDHRADAADNSELLWSLVNLELWQRQLVDRPAVVPAGPVDHAIGFRRESEAW